MATLGVIGTIALAALVALHNPFATSPPSTTGSAATSSSPHEAVGSKSSSSTSGSSTTSATVTEVRIDKSDHTLKLLAGKDVVKTYKVAIGSGGMGPKRFEGDKTTPVGRYKVAGRFKGLYHQFLNVSYPNEDDKKRFAELKKQGVVPAGRSVGFGIGIHGTGNASWNGVHKLADWTHGCIALDDAEIDELSRLVKDGTTITITD